MLSIISYGLFLGLFLVSLPIGIRYILKLHFGSIFFLIPILFIWPYVIMGTPWIRYLICIWPFMVVCGSLALERLWIKWRKATS